MVEGALSPVSMKEKEMPYLDVAVRRADAVDDRIDL